MRRLGRCWYSQWVGRGGRVLAAITFIAALTSTSGSAQDTVEFLNGAKVQGEIKQIRKAEKEFDFESMVGSRAFTRTYPFSKVHAVTMQGKRYVLTPKPVAVGATATGKSLTRTKAEVQATIAAAGNAPPDWLDATPLSYPKTLDLSWPIKPAFKGWNAKKNMVHYLYSTIQENPSRFHSGIRLVHHCLTLHESDKTLLQRDIQKLGGMYFELVKDYSHAAFWYQKVNPAVSQMGGIHLAECYWRLGNRDMALDMMRGKPLHLSAIKLLGDMGEIDWTVRLTRAFSKTTAANDAYLLCGDALRKAGRTDDAIRSYQRVVNSTKFRDKNYEDRFKGRARDSIEAIRVYDRVDVSNLADGTHRASAIGYAGKMEIEVQVLARRIQSVKVVSHREKRHYNALTDIPDRIIDKQNINGIDAISGATVTSQAIVNATAKALAKAQR
jgi:uncharacterized protein with FMN-binding domain